jgi:hypothetical protein
MENAVFKLGNNYIEISGPTEFVQEQLDKFRSLITESYEKILNQPITGQTKESPSQKSPTYLIPMDQGNDYADFVEVAKSSAVDHENVFVFENGRFQIICDNLPGNSTSARMIVVVLMYMWAQLRKGVETIHFSELREVCMNAGEFDPTNFSKAMDNNKRFFLLLGEGKSRTAKLVPKGVREAERIINELNKQ